MRYLINPHDVIKEVKFVDGTGAVHEVAVMPKSKLKIKLEDWQPVMPLPDKLWVHDDTPVTE